MKHSHNWKWPATAVAIACLAICDFAFAAFKCVDDKGITHYGDPLPPQCMSKAITELSGQGTVKSKTDAALTPEQIKLREEEKIKRKEEDKRAAEIARLDAALLATYGNVQEIDLSRDRTVDQITGRWKTSSQRLKEIDARLAALNTEMEFYREGKSKKKDSKGAPAHLVQDLERTQQERNAVDATMKKMEEEIKSVKERFEKDKVRWVELKKTGVRPIATAPTDKMTLEQLQQKYAYDQCVLARRNLDAAETGGADAYLITESGHKIPLKDTRERLSAASRSHSEIKRYCK